MACSQHSAAWRSNGSCQRCGTTAPVTEVRVDGLLGRVLVCEKCADDARAGEQGSFIGSTKSSRSPSRSKLGDAAGY